jgi:predicted nucleic acid-binding protein
MSNVYADAFFFLALLNKRDQWHQQAVEIIGATAGPIVTSQWVLAEVADAFSKPPDRPLFAKLLELIAADERIQVIGASNPQFQRGVELYLRRPDKSWSLTDCISFVIMKQRNIHEALTGDQHFEQAGFILLLSQLDR